MTSRASPVSLEAGTARVYFQRPELELEDPKLAALLCPEELGRMRRYLRVDDQRTFLAAHALLRQTLSAHADTAPEAWTFDANAYGRPEVSDRSLRFSLSHAPGLVGCLVSATADCGFDIEDTTRVDDLLEVARSVFAADECRLLESMPGAERRRRFFEIWTLKEAYVKARGMGLSLPLREFSFSFEPQIRFSSRETPAEPREHWHFELSYPTERHVAAVAIRHLGADFSVISGFR
ncbi:MAG: 4'-phosphopantetheinyl transferase superfamily protein [Myxococcales bacterium]|nr:4'-phosphopantetheinyl transferase superfamily protein [Myxococcales bacterium]